MICVFVFAYAKRLFSHEVAHMVLLLQIVQYVKDNLQTGTKLAVLDHIPSNTPFILPLEDIVPICKERWVTLKIML